MKEDEQNQSYSHLKWPFIIMTIIILFLIILIDIHFPNL